MTGTETAAPRITVWNENVHEREQPEIAAIYPDGIHGAIAGGLRELLPAASVATAALEQPEHGLSEDRLLIFLSNFSGGEVFRSGVTFRRGHGRIFYFSPGDQYYPVYYDAHIRRVLANAAEWARPTGPRQLPAVSNPPHGWFDGMPPKA